MKIRSYDRTNSCNCGKVTKGRGGTRAKLYDEKRSERSEQQQQRATRRRNGVVIDLVRNNRKTVDEKLEKLDDLVDIFVVPEDDKTNDKSFRNSTTNISKASTNTPRDNNDDNMVATNGNARRRSTDENINVDDEEDGCEECKCNRSSKKCEEASRVCKKHATQVADGGTVNVVKELGEDKQNGDYERRDSTTRSRKCTRSNSNVEYGVGKNGGLDGGEIQANGHMNGREHINDNVGMDVMCGKEMDDARAMEICGERKKRKSRFEEIFDECAEFGSNNDKRRSRKPPESYSPEPVRRIKLEQLFEEKIGNVVSPKVNRSRVKIKPVRKYKHKGPIFHYLDLYIRNKDLSKELSKEVSKEVNNDVKAKEVPTSNDVEVKDVEDEQLTVQVEEEKSLDEPSKSPLPAPPPEENDDVDEQTLNEDSTAHANTIPLQIDIAEPVKPSSYSDIYDNLLLTTTNKLTENKKSLPKPLALDAEIQSILGYRCDQGRHEFLVLFHNGTSNWVVQDRNISISTAYEDFYQNSEHDLSTINRLSYYISEYSNSVESKPWYPPSYSLSVPLPSESAAPSPAGSTSSSIKTKPVESCTQSETTTPKDIVSPKVCASTNPSNTDGDREELEDTVKLSPFCSGGNDIVYDRDLNDLCYYVMSSRHIKLYPCETTKEVVFKRDEGFVHIYLKNTKKGLESSLGKLDDQINMRSCEKLIYKLEDCAVDDTCEVVVISGIEEYFNLKEVFDKLVKSPSSSESKMYEQDISMLRYLIQTIRNFTKPICAVIKKTASGLPASMLSLFDMVFDERCEKAKKKKASRPPHQEKRKGPGRPPNSEKKLKESSKRDVDPAEINNGTSDTSFQAYLFPRLMGGLTESNECRIMGECKKLLNPEDLLSSPTYRTKRTFSAQLRKSLRNMKNNTKMPLAAVRKSSRSDGDFEETKEEDEDDEGQCVRSKQTAESIQTTLDNLEKEIEREKELTKQSMKELQSILLSMEPP